MISFKEFCRIDESDINLQPTSSKELKQTIKMLIKERGNKADLNDVDVSKVRDMFNMFKDTSFNGDISKWNVSNVTIISYMFKNSKFNGDISNWDVRKLKSKAGAFDESPLESNPPKWYK